jgi:hypothetical protein
MKPPTLAEAEDRGLLASPGVSTFSNGSAWHSWADRPGACFTCRFYDANELGAACAFEGAAFLHMCSAELRAMFGWLKHPEHGYHVPPQQCPFWRSRTSDGDTDDRPPPPEPDPHQLVLIADPTEDAALLVATPEPVLVGAPNDSEVA